MMSDLDLALKILPLELWNTLYMVFASTFFALLIGLPLGILLTITSKGHLYEKRAIYKALELLVNVGRSFPFAILMVALIPFTRWLLGTSLGTSASIVPLTIAAAPFIAKLIETSLKEVGRPMLEASLIMGSSTWQIIYKVLLPEALVPIISAITLTIVNLIGLSAMAGLVGGGGLGQVAIQYGYHRFNTLIMISTVTLLIFLVQSVQWIGNAIIHSILKKRGEHP
ncbi:MAG: methionine ABC transporter permease [Chlamydiales bacterium]|nr:methionine ABC transporter permease [Chlamydiales bacterium]